jgi:ferredoxin
VPKMRIDGRSVEVAAGSTLLRAARKLDIPIPTLCSLDGSEPFTSCMLCVVEETGTGRLLPACSAPAVDGMDVRTDTASVQAARTAALELLLAEHTGDCEAPCTLACPLQIDVPEVMRLLEEERVPEALRTIRSATALPGLVCLLCPAPCEKACRRGRHDQPVAIRLLMRHVLTSAGAEPGQAPPETAESNGSTVAVIGAGPAGLSAAYHLSLLGCKCSVLESERSAGGSLRGISAGDPPGGGSRGVDRQIDREVGILEQMGVDFRLNSSVDSVPTLGKIIDGHDAVIVAAGPRIDGLLEQASIRFQEGGAAASAASGCQSSNPKVFAAGSLHKPGCSFLQALAQGKTAAASANRYLRGQAATGARKRFQSHLGRLREGEIEEFLKGAADIPRVIPRITPADTRTDTPAGFNREEAAAEASRCLQCDCAAKDSCRLRTYAEQYGARARHFRIGERHQFRRILQHPDVVYEPGKCIKCGICVRITARENEQLGLAFLNRGYDLRVGTPFGELLSHALERSAQLCVQACPTGALAFRRRSLENPKNGRTKP